MKSTIFLSFGMNCTNLNLGAALDSTVDRAASGDSNMFGKTPAN